MEDTQRLKLHYVAAIAHKEVFTQQLNILLSMRGRVRWRRGARARSIWVRPWLHSERRRQFGIYGQLMLELRREDPRTFKKFYYGRSFEIQGRHFLCKCPNNIANFYCHQTINFFAECKLCEKYECQGDIKFR